MSDIRTLWGNDIFRGDWAMLPPGLAAECDLFTSVLISLFTHRRALDDDTLPDDLVGPGLPTPIRSGSDRRGWWADSFTGARIGSRLWLLSREKQVVPVLRRAEAYAAEALEWLVEDGVAERVRCTATIPRDEWLALEVEIARPRATPFQIRFDWAWRTLGSCASEPAPSGGSEPPPTVRVSFDGIRTDFSLTSLSWDIA